MFWAMQKQASLVQRLFKREKGVSGLPCVYDPRFHFLTLLWNIERSKADCLHIPTQSRVLALPSESRLQMRKYQRMSPIFIHIAQTPNFPFHDRQLEHIAPVRGILDPRSIQDLFFGQMIFTYFTLGDIQELEPWNTWHDLFCPQV